MECHVYNVLRLLHPNNQIIIFLSFPSPVFIKAFYCRISLLVERVLSGAYIIRRFHLLQGFSSDRHLKINICLFTTHLNIVLIYAGFIVIYFPSHREDTGSKAYLTVKYRISQGFSSDRHLQINIYLFTTHLNIVFIYVGFIVIYFLLIDRILALRPI